MLPLPPQDAPPPPAQKYDGTSLAAGSHPLDFFPFDLAFFNLPPKVVGSVPVSARTPASSELNTRSPESSLGAIRSIVIQRLQTENKDRLTNAPDAWFLVIKSFKDYTPDGWQSIAEEFVNSSLNLDTSREIALAVLKVEPSCDWAINFVKSGFGGTIGSRYDPSSGGRHILMVRRPDDGLSNLSIEITFVGEEQSPPFFHSLGSQGGGFARSVVPCKKEGPPYKAVLTIHPASRHSKESSPLKINGGFTEIDGEYVFTPVPPKSILGQSFKDLLEELAVAIPLHLPEIIHVSNTQSPGSRSSAQELEDAWVKTLNQLIRISHNNPIDLSLLNGQLPEIYTHGKGRWPLHYLSDAGTLDWSKGSWLVQFSFRDCAPCKANLPYLVALQSKFGELGLKVLILVKASDVGEEFEPRYWAGEKLPVMVVPDNVFKDFGIKAAPTTLLIKNGGIVKAVEGGSISLPETLDALGPS